MFLLYSLDFQWFALYSIDILWHTKQWSIMYSAYNLLAIQPISTRFLQWLWLR